MFSLPTRVISLSFAAIILVGSGLLMLPISSRQGIVTPFIDCLFTATSATCVTGLVVHDTFTYWTEFGQCVILFLIQVGGLGLVTFTTFFNFMIGKKLGLRGRRLAQESIGSGGNNLRQMVYTVIGVSLLVELVGALLLAFAFIPQYGPGRGTYISLFLSISAFCNAGFDILGDQGAFSSLSNYNGNPFVLSVIALLIIIGGIGFVVIFDLARWKKTKMLTLHTRVVLTVSSALIIAGALITLALEWNNPATIGAFPLDQKINASIFHSVSCRTAGFNTVPLDALNPITKVFSGILMFIGAAPGSTGGGIKCTTMAVIFMTIYCVVRGDDDTQIFHRRVDKSAVYKSLAVTMLGIFLVSVTSGSIVSTVAEVAGVDAFFESVSAFATVGLSAGVTAIATLPSRLMLIFCMYLGRLGPVTFFLSLAMRPRVNRREILPEGKIHIG